LFSEDGKILPITLLKAGPCKVVQKKTLEKDGYNAVQIGFEEIKEKKVNKPLKGHMKKSNEYFRYLKEIRDFEKMKEKLLMLIYSKWRKSKSYRFIEGQRFSRSYEKMGYGRRF